MLKRYGELTEENVKFITLVSVDRKELGILENQIESMKCCGNCRNCGKSCGVKMCGYVCKDWELSK